jgi:hypothetical protein
MGVHGGLMDRSLSRFSVIAVGALAVGSLLAGCASSGVAGPAVIVPPVVNAAAPTPGAQDLLAGLQQEITNELNAVNLTQSDSEPATVLVELNALTSKSGATEAEAFSSLMNTGSNQIAKRERIINALISDVETNSTSTGFLFGVTVNGVSLSHSLIALLDGVDGQLQAVASHIATDTLVDQLRGDIISIGASTRVYGLIEPIVHLVLAGGAELNALNILFTHAGQVQTKISQRHGNQAAAQATPILADLYNQISRANAVAKPSVEAVLALTASGFPGNLSTVKAARADLVQLKSPLGALNTGLGELTQLYAILGIV